MGASHRTSRSAPSSPRPGAGARFDAVNTHDCAFAIAVLDRSALLRVTGTPDQRIAAIAAVQRGRIARRQLLEAGLTRGMIAARLRGGRLHRRARGVYAVGHEAPVELGPETEALLTLGPRAVLSHLSAGLRWGLLRRRAPGRVDVTVAAACGRHPHPTVRVHRSRTLRRGDVRWRDGLRVTSAARTLLDLAASGELTSRELELAFDEALRQGLTTRREMVELVRRHPRRAGTPRLANLLGRDTTATVTESEAEEMLLALVRAAGLPVPEMRVHVAGYEVDALWRTEGVVVEVDGVAYHSSRLRFEEDRAKGSALAAAGLNVIRFTVRRMQDDGLRAAVELAQALARR